MAVVLAAGASSRMGRPKALLPVGGRPLVCAHVDALRAVGLEVRVVVGAHADRVARALAGADAARVPNPDWASEGPAGSLARAIADLAPDRTVVVTPVDVPPAPVAVLQALLAVPPPAVITVQGAPGHPVSATAGRLQRILPAGTLRDALQGARGVPVEWGDALRNLNTPAEWRAWREAQ